VSSPDPKSRLHDLVSEVVLKAYPSLGDVQIEGNLTIEQGAKITGGIRANSVAIAGEVEGNIEHAATVELLSTGVINGDVKAGTLTVAAGSRMRGRAEFGWGDDHSATSSLTLESRRTS